MPLSSFTHTVFRYNPDVHALRLYQLMCVYFPVLEESEAYLRAHPDCAVKVLDFVSCVLSSSQPATDHCIQIDKVACRARGDDLSRLRHRVIAIFAPDAVDRLRIKSQRGFKDVVTARMLCPVSKLKEFDQDPEA